MTGAALAFYGTPARPPYARADVLAGRVVKVNPALITLTDGLVATTPPEELRARVRKQVAGLLRHGVRTFHVDVNFADYGGFASRAPDLNAGVFTPGFLAGLQDRLRAAGAFLNLHLLTDRPLERLREYARAKPGAVCFQLDAVDDHRQLVMLIARIQAMGACPSPVIETVGTRRRPALPPAVVRAHLAPVLAEIGMLTFQAAATAARTSAGRMLNVAAVRAYLTPLRARFAGAVQLQGGITTRTIGDAVRLGADFVVCGSEVFHSSTGLAPGEAVDALLAAAAEILTP